MTTFILKIKGIWARIVWYFGVPGKLRNPSEPRLLWESCKEPGLLGFYVDPVVQVRMTDPARELPDSRASGFLGLRIWLLGLEDSGAKGFCASFLRGDASKMEVMQTPHELESTFRMVPVEAYSGWTCDSIQGVYKGLYSGSMLF